MKPNMNERIRNTKDAKVAEFSAFSFVGNLKSLLKTLFGRHYEPWIRRPLIPLRTLKRHVVNAIKHPYSMWGALQTLLANVYQICIASWWSQLQRLITLWWSQLQHSIAVSPKFLQLCLLTYYGKPRWHPLRLLVCPVLEAALHILEFRYRGYFKRFGAAVAALPRSTSDRRSLLLISGTLGPGGSERQTVLTVLGLAGRGQKSLEFAVVYLRNEVERFYQHKLESAGMPIIEFNRDTSMDDNEDLRGLLQASNFLLPELYDIRDYVRTLAARRSQIVHLWLDEVNIKGGLVAVAAGVPHIILSGRNLPPNNFHLYHPYMREGYRWLLRQPGVRLINNSVAGARAYERWLGLRKGSIRVVHNGFDFDEALLTRCHNQRAAYRKRHGIPLEAPLIGTVIRLNDEKRPLLWAEIAAHIGRAMPEAHFLVVGDGPLRPGLEARAALPDLAGRLHVVGLEKQALTAMAAMDLFLLSSRGEGLPNVLVEAQALGVPVVTTRAGGAPETLDNRRTGWVLASDRPAAAAGVVVRLLQDKLWLKRAGGEAKEFVRTHFGVERMLDETLQVYGSISPLETFNNATHSVEKLL